MVVAGHGALKVQPVFNVGTGSISYLEVFGGVAGTDWSHVAEATLADLLVLRKLRASSDDLLRTGLRIGINLSVAAALTVGDRFVESVAGWFGTERVLIELTEHQPAGGEGDCIPRLAAFIERCARHGIHVALDDLTRGHPHRNTNLWRAGVSTVKCLVSDPTLVSLAASARSLGIPLVAENIESPDDLRAALTAGASMVQGFFLRPPVPLPSGRAMHRGDEGWLANPLATWADESKRKAG